MRFKDKVALITAAANGIGRATAEIMAREGAAWSAWITIRNGWTRPSRRCMPAARRMGGCAMRWIRSRWTRLSTERFSEFGRIDILVNAVGGSTIIAKPSAMVEEHSLDDWQRMMKFNLDGTFLFTPCGRAGDETAEFGQDRQSGLDRRPRHERGQRQRLRRGEGRDHRVHPEAVVRTGAVRDQHQRDRAQSHADGADQAALEPALAGGSDGADRGAHHCGGWPRRSDQAKVICFLASSDADFVTGLTIDVTGGLSG